jgi:hypothetical protein
MNAKLPIKYLALLSFLIPALAVAFSYLFSSLSGHVPACLPYLTGCTSISRAARSGDTILFFRILMMPAAAILALYWIGCYQSYKQIDRSSLPLKILISGIIGACFLLLYVNFLGVDGSFSRFLRRTGVILYFAGTSFAQFLQVLWQERNYKFSNKSSYRLHRAQLYCCVILLLICFLHISTLLIYKFDSLGNISEWNFALFSNLFFLFSFLLFNSESKIAKN